MPPLPLVPSVVKVALKGSNNGVTWVNTFHLRYTGGPPTAGDMTLLASGVAAAWNTNVAPVLITSCSLTEVDTTDLSSYSGNIGSWTGTHAGAVFATAASASECMVVELHVARRFRGGHSRMYISGMTTGNYASGSITHWSTAFASSFSSAWAAFFTAVNALTYTSMPALRTCAVSFYWEYNRTTKKSVLRSVPLVDDMQTISVNSRICSQRRRLGKR